MAIFSLVADETNMLNQRFTTWECSTCHTRERVPEFPHVEVMTQVYRECENCEIGRRNYESQVNEPNEPA